MAGKKGSVKDADLRCCTWTWGAFVYINGMKIIWQIEWTAAEKMKALHTAQQLRTLLLQGKTWFTSVRDMHFSMLAQKHSCEKGSRTIQLLSSIFTSWLRMAPLRNEVVIESEFENVKNIFRQQAQQQVVPHILQPTDCRSWEFTVYSKELLRWDIHDSCL